MYRIPVYYDIEAGRFQAINEAFFRLKSDGLQAFVKGYGLWNANCIFCHNTRPDPGYDPASERFSSRVAELGIACEECHGPGALHVQLQHNPLRRYALRLLGQADPSITNPDRLPSLRSVQVCGQCHGQRLPRPLSRLGALMQSGDPYVPGQDLFEFYTPLSRQATIPGYDLFRLRFWNDGSPRLTAYELQGVLASKCFQRSESFTCTSCHSAHGGDPKGMIEPRMRTDWPAPAATRRSEAPPPRRAIRGIDLVPPRAMTATCPRSSMAC